MIGDLELFMSFYFLFFKFSIEKEADLVLGGDEGKECTYNNGYMKRQAIFSCLTCTPDGNAGVCTACSLSCHDGHEVISCLCPTIHFVKCLSQHQVFLFPILNKPFYTFLNEFLFICYNTSSIGCDFLMITSV